MIALLPMKGNSERVPGKNIRNMNGRPLFYYIGDKLKESDCFELLAIDTDSVEIAELAKLRYGSWVRIIERPKFLIGDEVPMNLIIEHDIHQLGIQNNFFQTHSTSPLIRTQTIQKAVELYKSGIENKAFDSVFSANALRVRLYDWRIKPINHNPNELQRTQDLDVIYEENSSFYIFSGRTFLKNGHRISKNPKIFEMMRNAFESIDIDEESDWEMVEKIIKANLNL